MKTLLKHCYLQTFLVFFYKVYDNFTAYTYKVLIFEIFVSMRCDKRKFHWVLILIDYFKNNIQRKYLFSFFKLK